jgi:hypothetical protein
VLCFLFARNFISESLLVVGQTLDITRLAFGFEIANIYSKNGKKEKSTIPDTDKKVKSQFSV